MPPGVLEFAGAGSHAAGGKPFFLERDFLAVLALELLAGACVLGDWAEDGFVVSGAVGCWAVGSCATGAFVDQSNRGEA